MPIERNKQSPDYERWHARPGIIRYKPKRSSPFPTLEKMGFEHEHYNTWIGQIDNYEVMVYRYRGDDTMLADISIKDENGNVEEIAFEIPSGEYGVLKALEKRFGGKLNEKWDVKKRGSNYDVVSQRTGKTMGSHSTKKAARQQQKAIYANVDLEKENLDEFQIRNTNTFEIGDNVIFNLKQRENEIIPRMKKGTIKSIDGENIEIEEIGPFKTIGDLYTITKDDIVKRITTESKVNKTTWNELDGLSYAKKHGSSWIDESSHIVNEINDVQMLNIEQKEKIEQIWLDAEHRVSANDIIRELGLPNSYANNIHTFLQSLSMKYKSPK